MSWSLISASLKRGIFKSSILPLKRPITSRPGTSWTKVSASMRYYSTDSVIHTSPVDKSADSEDTKEYFFDRFSEKIESKAGFGSRMYGVNTSKRYDLNVLRDCINNRIGETPRWVGQRKVKNTLYVRISGDRVLVDPESNKQAVATGNEKEFFWFKDGVMITYGSSDEEIEYMLKIMKPAEMEPLPQVYFDQMNYVYNRKSGINFETDEISLTSMDSFLEKLTTAHCLRRSLRLEVLEDRIDMLGKDISTRASDFFISHGSNVSNKGFLKLSSNKQHPPIFTQAEVFTIFGTLLRITSELNDDEVKYPPEYLWDSPQFERLYELMEKSLMIRSRFHSTSEALEASKKDIELIKDHFNVNHSFRLEIIIIVLIFVEVIMTLLEKSESYADFTWGHLYEFMKGLAQLIIGQ